MTGILSSCGESSSKLASPTYTVSYFDETGVQVGYAYVRENGIAPLVCKAMEGKEVYDFMPHSDMDLQTPGARYVFDSWEGTYDSTLDSRMASETDGTAIDLGHIKANCKVTAKFTEQPYKIETTFKNNGEKVEGGAMVEFGSPIAFPTVTPTEAHPEYYNTYAFDGWVLAKDDTSAKFQSADTLSYKWKSGTNANQFAWGLGAPIVADASGNKGVIYLDRTLTDHMPTYYSYISDGDKWIELGELSKGVLPLEFKSTYEVTKKEFTVSLYDPTNTTKVGSFNAEYGKTITFDRTVTGNVTTITVKLDDVIKYTYDDVTESDATKICHTMEGVYRNETDSANLHSSSIEGREMSFVTTKGEGALSDTPVGGHADLHGNVRIHPVVSVLH